MIDAATEEHYATAARRAADTRLRDEWHRANEQITNAVTGFRERSGHVPPNVFSGTRAVLRAAEQVARKLQT